MFYFINTFDLLYYKFTVTEELNFIKRLFRIL